MPEPDPADAPRVYASSQTRDAQHETHCGRRNRRNRGQACDLRFSSEPWAVHANCREIRESAQHHCKDFASPL